MKVTEPTDEQLMDALSRGDRAALSTLYARHGDLVHRVAWRYLGNADDARDMTQAVFLGLIDGARLFDAERAGTRFTTWLYRVVANRCLNHRGRAESRLRAREVDDDALAGLPGDDAEGPERTAERHELQVRLRGALDRLPERQRLAVVLSDVEGLSQNEVGESMACSVGSVESLLIRARQSLRTFLRTSVEDDHALHHRP